MPITFAQAQQLSQPKLTKKVIDQFRTSALIDALPFDNTVKPAGGNSLDYVYNRVTTFPGAASRVLNAEYQPSEAVTTAIASRLAIFGGSFQLDRALILGEHEVADHVQFQVEQKVKATIAQFHNMFINGNQAAPAILNSWEFDGLDVLLTGGAQEITPANPITLASSANITANWQEFLDQLRALEAVMDGAPSVYLMNQAMYAKFQSVMDRAGINLASKENYGRNVSVWGDSLVMALGNVPGNANPIIATTGAGITSIYAVRLGMDGVHGVSLAGGKLADVYLPNMQDASAVKTGAVEMIAGLAYTSTQSAAVLRNIDIA